ncbi:MAG: tetratricopeptide repeat protein [Desulfobulbaceae bacterium]|nr:tetratricopeptide repeat protein [Desulfobulbaceae bacterium]
MNSQSQMQELDFLLVGHDKEVLEQDARVLQQAGHKNIRIVRSGIEARHVLKNSRVHFVITDLQMPCMNGIELLRLIRRTPGLSDIPVLIISDNRQKEMILHAIDEKVDGYLATPYRAEDLRQSITNIHKRRKLTALQNELRLARHLILAKNYDKAIDKAKGVLAQDKNNSDALFLLSEGYYWQRELDKAKQFLTMYLKENPASGKGMHLLSKVCRLDGAYGDAFGLLLKAHKENPLNLDLAIDLGKFYLEMDMEDKAREIFAAVMSAGPTDLNLIKMGKAFLKKGRPEDAAAYLDTTIQPLPETAFIFALLGQKLGDGGNLEAAARQFRKCLELVPGQPEYLVKLAEIYLQQGDVAQAKEALGQCLRSHPGHAQARKLLEPIARGAG